MPFYIHIGGTAAPWSPSALFASSEVGAWYDPSDLSTMFQNSDGTVAVTADGDPVGYIADKSGNGNHATQATAAARPTYKTSGGLHWLEFDGVDDVLETSVDANLLFGGTGSDPGYLLAVGARFISATTTFVAAFSRTALLGDAGSYVGLYATNIDSAGKVGLYHWVTAASTVEADYTIGTDFVVSASRNPALGTAGRNSIRVNAGTSATVDVAALNNNALTFRLGRQGGNPSFSNSRIFSVILRATLSSEAEIEQAEAYIAGKTGVTL